MKIFSDWRKILRRHSIHIWNIAYFAGTRLISIAVFIIAVPFFIKLASDQQYGLAAIGFSLLGIGTVLDVGFGYVLIQSLGRRFARGYPPDTRKVNGLFSLYLVFAIVVAVVGGGIALTLAPSFPEKVLYGSIALLLPALAMSGVVAAVFQSQNILKPINLSRFFFEIAKALALVISAFVAKSILWIGPVMVVMAYCRAMADRWYLAKAAGISLNVVAPSQASRFWRLARLGSASLTIVIITILVTIGDKMLIKHLYGSDSVAYYSIAYDINTKAYLLVQAVNSAMFAVVLHRFARKTDSKAPIMAGIVTVSVVALVFYLPLAVWSEQLLSLWVNASFAKQSATLTKIMTGASLLYLYGNVFENALTAMGRARDNLSVYVVAITGYIISIPVYIHFQNLNGIMYSYMTLCAILCAGFFYKYYSVSKKYPSKSRNV
ncbi:hypothetical protein EOPP23_15165 [Endozoicomonas sp. OPT23]|uniref:lipopolysaccharide biosynthesis protein n=1 Tax=Endozoicomonas sp. OPT23 TaxID=2072845 RepID=UPI00129A790D|nr:hypothetical protein [Endozoicomonas sp. OPT23]MRI34328.1 hypothetical protein [Endozoicomonas sp. OPT23]